jgi:hypothetical protein
VDINELSKILEAFCLNALRSRSLGNLRQHVEPHDGHVSFASAQSDRNLIFA